MNENCTIINTDEITKPGIDSNLHELRSTFYKHIADGTPEVSICIQGFNRIEKTKLCVECVLKYTEGINYELVLVDSGSEDGTFEYFQELEYCNKKVIRITKNMGLNFAFPHILKVYTAPLLMVLPNDVIVTKNWMSNLLACIRSDDAIGMVCPCATNTSNYQSRSVFAFNGMEELQEKAAKFNVPNPALWEQRMRLLPTAGMCRREALDLAGTADLGFFHDFSEDDWCIRFRRAGFQLMLCGDTMVHHNHDLSQRDLKAFDQSLEKGRQNYQEKYWGLDAWGDVTNFESEYMALLAMCEHTGIAPRILGIDVKMGTPILEVCNLLRRRGIATTRACAYTTHAKYYFDLQTICSGDVFCDRIDYIEDYFPQASFDYVVLGEPINLYANPMKLLKKLMDLLSFGGRLLVKLRNTGDMRAFLFALGQQCADTDHPVVISLKEFIDAVGSMHATDYQMTVEAHNVDADSAEFLSDAVKATEITKEVDVVSSNMQIKNFVICIEK